MVLSPPNTTDLLQLMSLSVNKPAKDILKRHFEEWYSSEVIKQLDGKKDEATELEPICLGLPMLKELVEMAEYFADNSQIIANGFHQAGIASALDHALNELEGQQDRNGDTESDFVMSKSRVTLKITEVENN